MVLLDAYYWVINLIAELKWPAAILIALLMFRSPIYQILKTIAERGLMFIFGRKEGIGVLLPTMSALAREIEEGRGGVEEQGRGTPQPVPSDLLHLATYFDYQIVEE